MIVHMHIHIHIHTYTYTCTYLTYVCYIYTILYTIHVLYTNLYVYYTCILYYILHMHTIHIYYKILVLYVCIVFYFQWLLVYLLHNCFNCFSQWLRRSAVKYVIRYFSAQRNIQKVLWELIDCFPHECGWVTPTIKLLFLGLPTLTDLATRRQY